MRLSILWSYGDLGGCYPSRLVMVNYACAFSQSELGKYFEWIIMCCYCYQSLLWSIYNVFFIFQKGKPWTLQYILQQLVSKSHFWPTTHNGCRCDRETLLWIENGGFTKVWSEKSWPEWKLFAERASYDSFTRFKLFLINSMLIGYAEKGQCTEERKKEL